MKVSSGRMITYNKKMRLQFWAIGVVLAVAAGPAAAQPTALQSPQASAADLETYDGAFQESLRQPADPSTLVNFATVAVKVGDLEGAISALERLLLIDGDNPDLQLELGVLYFRLGSLDVARFHLEAARASKRSSTETRTRASAFLKEASGH